MGTRNMQIEGLRGLSILIIVLYHVYCRFSQLYMNTTVSFMENWGDWSSGISNNLNIFFV